MVGRAKVPCLVVHLNWPNLSRIRQHPAKTMRRFIGAGSICLTAKRSLCQQSGEDQYSAFRVKCQPRTKVIHFVRHAEGHHNVSGRNDPLFGYLREDLEDATLTDFGIEQCKALGAKSADIVKGAQLVVVSPLNRTMETASHSFPQLQGKVPWVALENVREQTGLHPCDRRKSITVHKENYKHIDFSGIVHDEDPLYHQYALREPDAHITARVQHFMRWLKERPETEIIVVSHHHYLQMVFRHVVKTAHPSQDDVDFKNCELRSFVVRFED